MIPLLQGHIGPMQGPIRPPVENPHVLPIKPSAAFWTSSIKPSGHTEWSLLLDESPSEVRTFRIIGTPRVLVLSSLASLSQASVDLGGNPVSDLIEWIFSQTADIFWACVADRYDAVWMPPYADSVFRRRSGWDVESTAWLRPERFLEPIS